MCSVAISGAPFALQGEHPLKNRADSSTVLEVMARGGLVKDLTLTLHGYLAPKSAGLHLGSERCGGSLRARYL